MSQGPENLGEPFVRVTKICNFATKNTANRAQKAPTAVLNTTDRQEISENTQTTGAFSGDSQDILFFV